MGPTEANGIIDMPSYQYPLINDNLPQYLINHPAREVQSLSSKSSENRYYIASIEFNKNKIDFFVSDRIDCENALKLDSIRILNSLNERISIFKFNYDYFTSPKIGRGWTSSSLSNLKRLKLESLIIKNDDKYIFTYNSVQLPPKTSFALDYWGYYNGQINNKTPFPNPIDFVNSSITYNNIDSMTPELLNKFCGVMFSDDFYCKANILEKIQYPTGGYSKLFYSLNEFNNLSITNNPKYGNLNFVKGNGLRIDSIIHYDNENNRCNQLFYHYIGGKLLNNLSFFYIKNEGYARISNKTLFQCSSDFFNILSNNASTSSPLNDITGVGYDSVYVIQPGEGKTLHTFTNNKEILPQYENKQLSWGFVNILPSYHKGLPNGLLTSELIYDKSDSLKKKTINTYKLIASNYIFYNSKVNYDGFFDLRPREAYHKVEVNYFPIYKTEALLETKEEISIFNGKELINTERYVYIKNNYH